MSESARSTRLSLRPGAAHPALPIVIASIGIGAVIIGVLAWRPNPMPEHSLTVYCAAALESSVKAVAQQYEQDYGVHVNLQAGSSGSLAAQIRSATKGDLYIPADDSFNQDAHAAGLVAETVPLAKMQLVLGIKPGNPRHLASLDDLLKPEIVFGSANATAAAGKMTKELLTKANRWEPFIAAAKVVPPTITELALAVQTSNLDAGPMWDVTAKQFHLDTVPLPEFAAGKSLVTAGVLKTTADSAAALRFARYLAAPGKGEREFTRAGFQPIDGDVWEPQPTLVVFSGGIQRLAIKDTLAEFEKREGCRINVIYEGCGVLLGMMRGSDAKRPDVYFACDVSFLTPEDIQPLFNPAHIMTETKLVMLTQKGNPLHLEKVEDLAKPGVKVGVAHEQLSALGALTKILLKNKGIYDGVRANVRSGSSPKADFLVTQILTGGADALDAVIVYEASTSQVRDKLDMIPIPGADSRAVQPLAVGRNSQHQELAHRLEEALETAKSKQRFEQVGFQWRAEDRP
ncbi:MAG TPA: extracellular solute-binding protein [Pirellulales bacterium]|jgi:molybdenum ABC transporter molybdate-binding protein|nr:extracellular solute-binding protein [Pirellulales bacterium]